MVTLALILPSMWFLVSVRRVECPAQARPAQGRQPLRTLGRGQQRVSGGTSLVLCRRQGLTALPSPGPCSCSAASPASSSTTCWRIGRPAAGLSPRRSAAPRPARGCAASGAGAAACPGKPASARAASAPPLSARRNQVATVGTVKRACRLFRDCPRQYFSRELLAGPRPGIDPRTGSWFLSSSPSFRYCG